MKSAIVIIVCIMTFFVPTEFFLNKIIPIDYTAYINTLISTAISTTILFYAYKYITKIEIDKPKWKSSLFSYKNPLSIIQFFGVCLIFFGIILSTKNYFMTEHFNTVSTLIFFFGLGIIFGIHLAFFIDSKINLR